MALAQDDNPGFVERTLEEQLSAEGRVVEITGFRGALSSEASLDVLTVSDEDGVWLIVRDAVLDWQRAALLRGRVEVSALSAGEIVLERMPGASPDAPAPEASGFSLPDLPVAIRIGSLEAERIVLGEDLFGEAAELSLAGSVGLAGGEGSAEITAERIDGQRGSFTLAGSYANATEALEITLALDEAEDGIAANLIGVPGRPSVQLSVDGTGTLADFGANLVLATDGEERLAGQLALQETDDQSRAFFADVSGNIAPLLAPDYRAFFGPDVALRVAGAQEAAGGLRIDEMGLTAAAVDLTGALSLAPGGVPERVAIEGVIAAPDGAPVLLPLSGARTEVGRVGLAVGFDSTQSEAWQLAAEIEALDRPGLSADRVALTADGLLTTEPPIAFTGDVGFLATALDLGNPDAEAALGETVEGRAQLAWRDGGPLDVTDLVLEGETYALEGAVSVEAVEGDADITADFRVAARDLAVFSGLANRDLSGAANARVQAELMPVAGTFDATVGASLTDATVGIAEVDQLLSGRASLITVARRTEEGTFVERLVLRGPSLVLDGSAVLATGASQVSAVAELIDTSVISEGFPGPLNLRLEAAQDEAIWAVDTDLDTPDLTAAFGGTVETGDGAPVASGALTANVTRLSVLSDRAGRPLSGAIEATAEGRVATDLSELELIFVTEAQGLGIGQADADRLLAGRSVASGVVRLTGETLGLETISVQNRQISLFADGALGPPEEDLTVEVRLTDVAPYLAGLSGAAEIEGIVGNSEGGGWRYDLDAVGPARSAATIAGTAAADFSQVNAAIRGDAPLAVANRFIAPRTLSGTATYDLAVNGAPGVGAVSGTVRASDARASAAIAGLVIEGIDATVQLGGGAAQIALAGRGARGGTVRANGPLTLSAPFQTDLTIAIQSLGLNDPELYETSLGGSVQIVGPLAGGARIGGALTLGETLLRIPSGSVGAISDIPDVTHVNEPVAVRQTRARAGLIGEASGTRDARAAFPLDLTISAPNRVFVRGRGLDAELGGQLRLRGTTADIRPAGQFELIRGRLDILGQRLVLTEGRATLQGEFDPFLRLVAEADADDVTVFIIVEGPASAPEIRFLSEPQLPEDEVLARLLFGRGIETLSPLQAAQLAAAVATLAGQGGDGIVGRLRQNFGLDDLDVTTDETGGTAVRAGRYLSDNVYTDVTVGSQGGSEVNLNLDISPSVTVKGSVDSEGETGIGVFFERDY
ncbi:MAG: translocation/assembly module TamB domain-containing protein [Pseudomonadota bacterium]